MAGQNHGIPGFFRMPKRILLFDARALPAAQDCVALIQRCLIDCCGACPIGFAHLAALAVDGRSSWRPHGRAERSVGVAGAYWIGSFVVMMGVTTPLT
jgi:hypothetical protein